jgi:hypothetical protein
MKWYGENRSYACFRESLRRANAPEAFRQSHLKRNRGITTVDYDKMLANQEGKCAICHTDTPSKRRKYFDIDHCHATGKVRGLLCEVCNRAIGLLKDSPEMLRRAADYLET